MRIGAGRSLDIPAPRLAGWLERFHASHVVTSTHYLDGTSVVFEAADGVVAECTVPLGPIGVASRFAGMKAAPLLSHVTRPVSAGVLLVRLGGYAVGMFGSDDRLIASKVDSRLVHGRQRNGGSSQARYTRRRENEVRDQLRAAADTAARVLRPFVAQMEVFVVGGDKTAVAGTLADRRLAPLVALRTEPFLTVPDPKRAVLDSAPSLYRSTRIRVHEKRNA